MLDWVASYNVIERKRHFDWEETFGKLGPWMRGTWATNSSSRRGKLAFRREGALTSSLPCGCAASTFASSRLSWVRGSAALALREPVGATALERSQICAVCSWMPTKTTAQLPQTRGAAAENATSSWFCRNAEARAVGRRGDAASVEWSQMWATPSRNSAQSQRTILVEEEDLKSEDLKRVNK